MYCNLLYSAVGATCTTGLCISLFNEMEQRVICWPPHIKRRSRRNSLCSHFGSSVNEHCSRNRHLAAARFMLPELHVNAKLQQMQSKRSLTQAGSQMTESNTAAPAPTVWTSRSFSKAKEVINCPFSLPLCVFYTCFNLVGKFLIEVSAITHFNKPAKKNFKSPAAAQQHLWDDSDLNDEHFMEQ